MGGAQGDTSTQLTELLPLAYIRSKGIAVLHFPACGKISCYATRYRLIGELQNSKMEVRWCPSVRGAITLRSAQ